MALKLAFLTGSRSEYGLAKALLRGLQADSRFALEVIPNGLHLLNKFGLTINEIRSDGFYIRESVNTYSETGDPKYLEFSRTLERMSVALEKFPPDVVFVIGDRIESYASALAAHFIGIPVVHSGGGHITQGAVDNIYRYNISNIASLHFATSRMAYERLSSCPGVNISNAHFIGSVGVDAINYFKRSPIPISEFVPALRGANFVLMTFHPVTSAVEPISELMQHSIDIILENNNSVLITYPNNDEGCESIFNVIDRNRQRAGVHIVKSLGAKGYYSALSDCRFVIGNSSSGVSEAPYFEKAVLNIGSRQAGRDKDVGVTDVEPNLEEVRKAIEHGFKDGWPAVMCSNLYGNGHSVDLARDIIFQQFGSVVSSRTT